MHLRPPLVLIVAFVMATVATGDPSPSLGPATPSLATLPGIVPIASGGTGATTGATALAALGGVPATRNVTAGVGLSGGGALSADVTITLPNTGTAGTNTKVTTDAQGRVTTLAAASLASADYANQGTTTTVLHGNAAGNPSFTQVTLTTDVTGVLPATNGGTGVSSGAFSGAWTATAVTGGVIADGTSFSPGFTSRVFAGKFRDVSCSSGVAGTGGTTGIVVKIRDVTASSDLCSCTLGACTTTALVNNVCDCNSAASTAAHTYVVVLSNSTDCAVNPQSILCSVELTQQ